MDVFQAVILQSPGQNNKSRAAHKAARLLLFF